MTNPNITPELERAARAIYKTLYDDPATEAWMEDNPFELTNVGYDGEIDFVRVAAIVLRSLLPPSEGMVEILATVPIECGTRGADPGDSVRIFTAMINRVLGETVDG